MENEKNTITTEEDRPLMVCWHCLLGIESREGTLRKMEIFVDETDETESKCDWCEESGFDTLYEL